MSAGDFGLSEQQMDRRIIGNADGYYDKDETSERDFGELADEAFEREGDR